MPSRGANAGAFCLDGVRVRPMAFVLKMHIFHWVAGTQKPRQAWMTLLLCGAVLTLFTLKNMTAPVMRGRIWPSRFFEL